MALFFGQACPLCGVKMTNEDRRFATSHFLGPESDLWQFSDAVMHWDCYAKWEHQARFGRLYFEAKRKWTGANSFWGVAHSDEQVLVTTNPDRYVAEVDVMLAETGSGHRIALAMWEDWLNGKWFECCRHEIEREALAAVIPFLRSKFSTAKAVVESAGMKMDADSEIAAKGGMVARIAYEFACEKLAELASSKGIACRVCGIFPADCEYVRIGEVSETGPQSHLVCRDCGGEFGPDEN